MPITKYLLLAANNVDTNIDATPYSNKLEAREAMQEAVDDLVTDFSGEDNDDESTLEVEVNNESASVFTGGPDGDLYYWCIQQIDVEP